MTRLRLIVAGAAIGMVFAGALLAREPETTPPKVEANSAKVNASPARPFCAIG